MSVKKLTKDTFVDAGLNLIDKKIKIGISSTTGSGLTLTTTQINYPFSLSFRLWYNRWYNCLIRYRLKMSVISSNFMISFRVLGSKSSWAMIRYRFGLNGEDNLFLRGCLTSTPSPMDNEHSLVWWCKVA